MSEWYYANNSQSCGPFSEEDFKKLIKGGMVNHDTYVWNSEPGNAERGWERAADTELNTFFNRKSPPPPPPTDVRAQKPDSTDYTYNGGQRQQKNAEIFPNVMHELGAKLGAKLENFFKLAEPPSTESPLDAKAQKPDSTDYIHNDRQRQQEYAGMQSPPSTESPLDVKAQKPDSTDYIHNNGQRQQEYTGTVYKCSNCGEALQSFVTHCPTCGFELRGAKATNTVRELAAKLEVIESRREYQKKPTFFEKLFDSESNNLSTTDEQKVSLIRSFVIPNSISKSLMP